VTAKLVTLHSTLVKDIPAMLRRCADSIEAGERGEPFAMAAVMVDTSGDVAVWGWGNVDTELTAIGLLTLGSHYLTQNKVERG
jgi:hypothetical protein